MYDQSAHPTIFIYHFIASSGSYSIVLLSWREDSGITSMPASVTETLHPGAAVELLRTAWTPGFNLGRLAMLARG